MDVEKNPWEPPKANSRDVGLISGNHRRGSFRFVSFRVALVNRYRGTFLSDYSKPKPFLSRFEIGPKSEGCEYILSYGLTTLLGVSKNTVLVKRKREKKKIK